MERRKHTQNQAMPKQKPEAPRDITAEEAIMARFREEVGAHFLTNAEIFGDRYRFMDLRELTMADAIMWNRVQNYTKGSVTLEDLKEYRQDVERNRNPSRTELQISLAGQLTTFWIKEAEEANA